MSVVAAYRRLLRNGPLSRLLLGEFISSVGDRMYLVALLVLVYRESRSPAVLAVVGAIRLAPYVLFSIPAGVVADRFDRRYVLLMSDAVRGVCMLVLAVLVVSGGSVVAIAITAFVAASFSPFFHPAIRALIPSLVRDESEYGPANSVWATLDNLAMVVGPVVAGVVIAIASVEVAFALNAMTFGLIAVILLSLPPAKARPIEAAPLTSAERSTPRRSRFRDVVDVRAVTGLLVQENVTWFAFGALDILVVVLAIDTFRGGEAATGYLTAAIGVGGVVGAVLAGIVVVRRRLGPAIIAAAATFSGSLVLLGISPDLAVAFLAITLVALGHQVMDVVRATLSQTIVPDAYRGRYGGLLMATAGGAEALGVLIVPILATTFGLALILDVLAVAALAATAVTLALLGAATNQGREGARSVERPEVTSKPA